MCLAGAKHHPSHGIVGGPSLPWAAKLPRPPQRKIHYRTLTAAASSAQHPSLRPWHTVVSRACNLWFPVKPAVRSAGGACCQNYYSARKAREQAKSQPRRV